MPTVRPAVIACLLWIGLLPAGAALPPCEGAKDLPDLVAGLLPAVVNISILKQRPAADGSVAQGGQEISKPIEEFGSGFLIDPAGYIVTNRHVIAAAYKVTVTLNDGQPYPGIVVATNERPDLALLKIDAGHPLPTVPWGDSDKMRIGEAVIAIGNPLGLSSSISVGVVSALNRDLNETMIDDFIQTDAAINHGNSGGPLFNLRGEVIGVNWALISPTHTSGSIGLGLAIPSNDAAFVADHMRRFGRLRAGFVGMRLQQVSPDMAAALHLDNTDGGIVTLVRPGGPADAAGVRPGDVVVQFGARHTTDVRALLRVISTTLPGTVAPMVVWRAGQTRTVQVAVADWPKGAEARDPAGEPVMPDRGQRMTAPDLGLRLAPITDQARQSFKLSASQSGVIVLGVAANSVAADIGIAPGDMILRVQDDLVATPGDVLQRLAALRRQGRDAALLLVQTQDRPRWVTAPLSES